MGGGGGMRREFTTTISMTSHVPVQEDTRNRNISHIYWILHLPHATEYDKKRVFLHRKIYIPEIYLSLAKNIYKYNKNVFLVYIGNLDPRR